MSQKWNIAGALAENKDATIEELKEIRRGMFKPAHTNDCRIVRDTFTYWIEIIDLAIRTKVERGEN